MNFSRWTESDALIEEALALPPADREAFINRACAGAPDLAALVRAVVREDDSGDPFLAPGGPLAVSIARELADALGDDEDEPEALAPGDRLGDFEIVNAIGHGGMGEVYLARDLRLGRRVAIKVLPRRFAAEPDRIARFRREARFLASLNHPNVAIIHGVAERAGVEALVLELVEGPTLSDRLASGPLAIAEAIRVGRDVARALAAAHGLGIVHRDLKPANIKFASAGDAKVLDFGLARVIAIERAEDGAPPRASSVVERPGLVLGTAAYMSPEQARGEPVDQRSDIWSFGCVLFEMLTGGRAFQGGSYAEILAGILERTPDFSALPADTPEPIRRLLRHCLEKDAGKRLDEIGAAIPALEAASLETTSRPATPAPARVWRRLWPAAVAAVALASIVLLGAAWRLRLSGSAAVTRLVVPVPSGDELVTGVHPLAAISPDGRTLVYRARRGGTIRLFRNNLDAVEPTPVPGSENASTPFFSPDGRWLAFDADGTMKKISQSGGPPLRIAEAPGGLSASWGPDGRIVFSTPTLRVLHWVDADGGTPVALTRLDEARGELAHTQPFAIAGGDVVLFTIVRADSREIAALRVPTGERTVVTTGMQPRLLPGGRLLFARENTLWAAPFDAAALRLAGDATPVLEGLELNDIAHFAVSESGTLAYVPQRAPSNGRTLTWFDPQGRQEPVPLPPAPYLRATLSPDDRRIALAIEDNSNTDIWVADVERAILTRLTSHPTVDTAPLWSPDGRFIVFRSERDGGGLFRRAADASDDVRRVTRSDGPYQTPYAWTPDGRFVLLAELSSYRLQRIRRASLADGRIETLLDGDFAQLRPRVSPDGRWLAYQSDESGRFEVYVRPFPNLRSARWQVSAAGGTSPRWTQDGAALLYYDGRAVRSMPVQVSAGAFVPATAAALFDATPFMGRLGPDFDVTANGRLLMLEDAPALDPVARRAQLVLVRNWVRDLDRQVGERHGS